MRQHIIQNISSQVEESLKGIETIWVRELTSDTTIEIKDQQSTSYNRTTELDWIFPVIVNITLIVTHVWLLISLIHYGIKNKKWQQKRNKSEDLSTGLVYNSVVGCAVACILRLVVNLVLMNIGFSDSDNGLCDKLTTASSVSYGIVHLFVALFLWSRQRYFFANNFLQINYSRPIKCFSSAVIVFILGLGIYAASYFCINMSYSSRRHGCVLLEYEEHIQILLIPALAVMFYNVTLLGLLFYALTRAKSFSKKIIADVKQSRQENAQDKSSSIYTITTSTCKSDCQTSISNRIKAILRRTMVFAIFSIFIDLFLHVFIRFLLDPNDHFRFAILSSDIASFFNLLFVILSFDARKKMMTSPCKKIG